MPAVELGRAGLLFEMWGISGWTDEAGGHDTELLMYLTQFLVSLQEYLIQPV